MLRCRAVPASVDNLARALAAGPVVAYGVPPAYAAFTAARLSRDPDAAGPVVLVVPDDDAATAAAADLRFWRADPPADLPPIAVLAAVDVSPYADLAPDRAALAQRLTTLLPPRPRRPARPPSSSPRRAR